MDQFIYIRRLGVTTSCEVVDTGSRNELPLSVLS